MHTKAGASSTALLGALDAVKKENLGILHLEVSKFDVRETLESTEE